MRTTLLLVLGLAGCEASAEVPAKQSFSEQVRAVHARMHARFTASRAVEQAIAVGDLERARSEIASMHDKIDHLLHSQWEQLVEMQQVQLDLLRHAAILRTCSRWSDEPASGSPASA